MSPRRRRLLWGAGGAGVLLLAGALAAPSLLRHGWSARSSNPVRRGVARAAELGCFACHGFQGAAGVPDPGLEDDGAPAWSGGVWMMYVESEEEIREFILDGVGRKRAASLSARAERERAAVKMPAYRDVLRGSDLDDLTAAFLVLSEMRRPPRGSPEGRGYDLAKRWRCFSCHGPGGCGGVENPGSFTGLVPGWYGPELRDLVRSRQEFDEWIREGAIERLASHPVASRFLARQRIQMPAYRALARGDLDDLWAYAGWLEATGGGTRAPGPARPE